MHTKEAGLAALSLLLSRHSTSAKHLAEPGPTDSEIEQVVLAALRAPDHNKLVPFRFLVFRGEDLERLARLFEDYGARRGRSGRELEAERQRAKQAPVVLGVLATIAPDNPDVPVHEQWACVGGAISNAVTALHFLGYGAKMVSGVRAADERIAAAHAREGEQLVGWIVCGTPTSAPKARGDIDPRDLIRRFGPS